MKTILPILLVLVVSFACRKHEELHKSVCGTSATVRDLSSQTGCGFVFELADGTKLTATASGTSNHSCKSQKDVLSNFPLADSKKVKIGYELVNNTLNACGAKAAKVTCIEEDNSAIKE